MKCSRFNVLVDYPPDGVTIVYNSVSGGMVVFDPENMETVHQLLNNPDVSVSPEHSKIRENLIQNRFLIGDDEDEFKILKMRNSLSRFNTDDIALVLAPTMRCPLVCPYCYVDRKGVTMSRDTIDALKKFVEKKMEKARHFSLSWTGGEPLLALDIIEELNPFFIGLCEEKKIDRNITLVTSGWLMGPENVERLKRMGIRMVQITLDGTAPYHNRYRVTAGGQGTYDTILKNIVHATRNGMKVTLRSNIDRTNKDDIYRMIDEVAVSGADLDNIGFAPCMISIMAVGDDPAGACRPYTKAEFARIEPELWLYAMKKGFRMGVQRLSATFSYCGANTWPLNVIDASGNVLKCWCHLGDSEGNKVGVLTAEGGVQFTDIPQLSRWLCWDPFDIAECKECPVLPLCMGGCMYYNIMGRTHDIEAGCTEMRHNLEKILILCYLSANKTKLELNTISEI